MSRPCLENRIGKRYGRLVVMSIVAKTGSHVKVLCQCDCGTTKIVFIANLGSTKSCGCLRNKHGHSSKYGKRSNATHEYRSWDCMIQRCTNSHHKQYAQYGGRGITVCVEWRNSFKSFINDMGVKPSSKYTIDRIDNEKGYTPINCRWATAVQQQNNKRNNRFIYYNGQRMTVAEAARMSGIRYGTVFSRIARGWKVDRIFDQGAGNV